MVVLAYLFAEVMISTAVATQIGGLWMFTEVLGTAALGLMMLTGLRDHMMSLANDLMARRLNEAEVVASSVFRLIGAALLIMPGIVTDVLGLALQVPFLGRRLIRRFYQTKPQPKKEGDPHGEVIDVEVVDSRSSLREHSGSGQQ